MRARTQWGSSPLTRGKHHLDCPAHHELRLIPAHAGKTCGGPALMTGPRAHPRSRGENQIYDLGYYRERGSSPLTRGKRCPRQRPGTPRGLIPAHAGKTTSPRLRTPSRGAHPRSRGENFAGLKGKVSSAGSSPLTRGKPLVSERLKLGKGLIPAHAGKTRPGTPRVPNQPAHPRSRGENDAPDSVPGRPEGSSPLTRGKHPSEEAPTHDPRLIPAHAGKTPRS